MAISVIGNNNMGGNTIWSRMERTQLIYFLFSALFVDLLYPLDSISEWGRVVHVFL